MHSGHAQVCGLAWSPDDRSLASGGNDNQLLVWNAHSASPVLRFTEHQVRLSKTSVDRRQLSVGLCLHGRRVYTGGSLHLVMQLLGTYAVLWHGVCASSCSEVVTTPCQTRASGQRNARSVAHRPEPLVCNAQAAVKAIAWSPHQHGLLASGGGTADRCIRYWNTTTGAPLSCVDTGSQARPHTVRLFCSPGRSFGTSTMGQSW